MIAIDYEVRLWHRQEDSVDLELFVTTVTTKESPSEAVLFALSRYDQAQDRLPATRDLGPAPNRVTVDWSEP